MEKKNVLPITARQESISGPFLIHVHQTQMKGTVRVKILTLARLFLLEPVKLVKLIIEAGNRWSRELGPLLFGR